jgi:outer membrane biosynthesis protein TonB
MKRDRPGKVSMVASAGVHSLAALLVWSTQSVVTPEIQFIAYEIELVSPPPVEEPAEILPPPQERVVVETPELERPPPDEDDVPDPEQEDPGPEPERTATVPREEPVETTEEASSEEINVRMEGLQRDYPVYYENIIRQINRCFRWRGEGDLETSVGFAIREDGGVTDLRFIQESGNVEFDITAMGAVECAVGRFGPLPDDLPFDRIPIIFSFRPVGRELEPTDAVEIPVQGEQRRWGEQGS